MGDSKPFEECPPAKLQPGTDTGPEPLDVAAVAAALGPLTHRFNVDVLEQCDSTNTRLLAAAEVGAPAGSVIAARQQTAGRGRRGRTWLSAAGDSLTFSLLWRGAPGRSLSGLSLAVGLAIAESLEALCIQGVMLKWPNDILLSGRKLAGVLVEVVPGTHSQSVVIGIGINLRVSKGMPDDIRRTSIALDAAGIALPSTNTLLASLLAQLHRTLTDFDRTGFAGLRDAWRLRHAFEGQSVRLLSDLNPTVEGLCRGVDGDGALLLETPAGVQRIISGEVSLRKI